MERKEGGYFIRDEDLKTTAKALGVVGIGCLVVGALRALIGGPVIRIQSE